MKAQTVAVAIAEMIAEGRVAESERIPTMRVLAVTLETDKNTVSRAVGLLKEKGLVVSRTGRGGGTFVCSGARQAAARFRVASDRSRGTVYTRLLRRLTEEIEGGEVRGIGVRGGFAELCDAYAVSAPTMRKALRALTEEGLLVRRAGGYSMPRSRRSPSGDLVFVRGGFRVGDFARLNDRHTALVDGIERYAGQSGIGLKTVVYRRIEGSLFASDLPSGLLAQADFDMDRVLGIVLSPWILPAEESVRLVDAACHLGVPVSVIEESDPSIYQGILKQHPACRVFSLGPGRSHAETVGRYLKRKGHRAVVYLSHAAEKAASGERLAGLQQIMPTTGAGDGVREISTHLDAVAAGSRVGPKYLEELLADIRSKGKAENGIVNAIVSQWRHVHSEFTTEYIRQQMMPLLTQALSRTLCTAWVAFNDQLASICAAFLKQKGLRVPQDIAIVGFDNTPLTAAESITSYDFDISAIVAAAVRHCTSAPSRPGSAKNRPIEIPGFVVSRRSG